MQEGCLDDKTLLSYYNFKIVHIKGIDNYLAKFLSRNVEYTI